METCEHCGANDLRLQTRASLSVHGGAWEDYDAIPVPPFDNGPEPSWKTIKLGNFSVSFHEPRYPRPVPEPPAEPETELTCLTCGRRESEHYSFGLDPISVCEPGQYARRWRPASDVMDCGLRRSECSDPVLHAPMAPEAGERGA